MILTIEFSKTNCTFALYIKNQEGNSIGLWKWVVGKKKLKWRFIILGSQPNPLARYMVEGECGSSSGQSSLWFKPLLVTHPDKTNRPFLRTIYIYNILQTLGVEFIYVLSDLWTSDELWKVLWLMAPFEQAIH